MPPSRVRIEPSDFSPLTTWTVAQVRSALVRHDEGDLYDTAQLADQLRRDAAIFGDLSTRVRAIAARSGLPFSIDPSMGVDDRRSMSIARKVEAIWHTIAPEHVIESLMVDAVLLGVAIGRIEWETQDGEWIPRLRWLPPHGLRYVDHEKRWRYLTGDGKDLVVTPGDGAWFLHLPHGDRSWLWGAVRALAFPWKMRCDTTRDWARYSEKHGMPVLAVKEPYFATDDAEGTAGSEGGLASVYRQFRTMGSETVLRLPQGPTKEDGSWDAAWIEPTAQSFEGFSKFLDELRRHVRVAILGYDSAAESKGGDGELASQRVKVEYLSADCEPLTTSLREQVLKPLVRWNHDASRPELAPWPRWDTRPLPDLKARAELLNGLGDALGKLETQGVDTDSVLEEFQLRRIRPPAAPVAPIAPVAAPEDPEEPDDEPEETDDAA